MANLARIWQVGQNNKNMANSNNVTDMAVRLRLMVQKWEGLVWVDLRVKYREPMALITIWSNILYFRNFPLYPKVRNSVCNIHSAAATLTSGWWS